MSNLSCGRVKFEAKNATNLNWWSKKENHWEVMDFLEGHWNSPNCNLTWHQDGMTCICNQPGTYALLRAKHVYKVSMINSTISIFMTMPTKKIDKVGDFCISPGMGSLLINVSKAIDLYLKYAITLPLWAGPFPGGIQIPRVLQTLGKTKRIIIEE